ncbi:BsuPI-related putative proteinase inhibitor [Alkalihalobacillus trypoxylicola]|uniref:Intracellular proteinase inhibitor BsuPI domain-containing protein n=1 Tax=Alkalihalobacillus trypoxylicola TaxID=519424 RepID=A0A161Q788_9BACI|nr:BsuPI-related putative proteinase inhibitor [Alkalihalobacillus trypoxylicola]KYG32358.1 hypothetical protein AZF04_06245 [Alkalihalobacillus trypoxylicola]
MKNIRFILIIMGILLLGACGTQTSTGDGSDDSAQDLYEGESIVINDVEFTQQINLSDEESLDVVMQLKNVSQNDITLAFSSGQKMEIVLRNEQGEEVYRYSEGKMFTMAIENKTLAPDEHLSFGEYIDVSEFEAGEYTVELTSLVYEVEGEEENLNFQEEITITLP